MNQLEPSDAGAVETFAFLEGLLVEFLGGDGEMLLQAREVHETQIDGADLFFADEGQDFFGCHERGPPERRGAAWGGCRAL